MRIVNRSISHDGSVKRVHELSDGVRVESVLIPHTSKTNLCVSVQAGCRQACAFCATGRYFKRDLTAEEIAGQVDAPVDSVVLMGMGEPLDNPNTLEALELIKSKGIPSRKIVVSTCGITPMIESLLPGKVNIAVSIHATTEEQRSAIMPVNKRYPLSDLSRKLFEVSERLPSKRRLQAEYLLIKGFNDSLEDARRLSQLLPKKTLINLLPVHPAGHGFLPPDSEAIALFKSELRKAGFICYVRESRGLDVHAACGMLTGQFSAKH